MFIQADTRIKQLRLSRGMTQTELAKVMSVTRSSVNAWEMGISVPTAAKLVELSIFLAWMTRKACGWMAIRRSRRSSSSLCFPILKRKNPRISPSHRQANCAAQKSAQIRALF